ncbi:MAG: HD domain-containing protein [Candidatus Electryonea clarkiae]|nr:HD domain-containing protein [Candidatus Electryonea clarkiae]
MSDTLKTNGDGIRCAIHRTEQADVLLRKLLQHHKKSSKGLGIFAVGGYGRSDNTLRSDLDLVLLIRDDISPHEKAINKLVQGLWDNGWSPAQTVLKLHEIDADFLAIPDRASALLESRFLWGDISLADGLDIRLCSMFDEFVWNQFIESKVDEFILRRRKYGEVVRVVEPDLKSQAGGLRDLHHVFWIERARTALDLKWFVRRRRSPSVFSFLNRLYKANLLDTNEINDLHYSFDLMLRVREALRRVTLREENKLTVGLQPQVGKLLGFDGDDRTAMQALMRAVYRAMGKTARFSEEFSTLLAESGLKKSKKKVNIPDLAGVSISGDRILLEQDEPRLLAESPKRLIELINACHNKGMTLSGVARHQTRQAICYYWQKNNDPHLWAEALRGLFDSDHGFGSKFRMLAELDAIEPWLPEWKELSGFTTGSYYHAYTVDEHTLRALEELDNLPNDGKEGMPESTWLNCENRVEVYLSILLHDIGKCRSGNHSDKGADIAVRVIKRLGWHELATPVAKLVRKHLMMEQNAFRRDCSDPAVIEHFAEIVGDIPSLNALYLLTVCDLRAVRKGVWTIWKGHLLSELLLSTQEWFKTGRKKLQLSYIEKMNSIAEKVGSDDDSVNRVKVFLESMEEEYLRVVESGEVAEHLAAMEEVIGGKPFRWLINTSSGFVTLTIVTRDRIGLLAQVAGLFVSQGIGIREARIFTRKDGIAVDRFRAEDIEPNGVPLEERLNKINDLWNRIEHDDFLLEKYLDGYKRRKKLTGRPAAVVESEVVLNRSENGWLIDVSGTDSTGLLYRLCTVISLSGLDLQTARVSGRLDGIHDAFFFKDPKNLLNTKKQRDYLIESLRQVISVSE